MVTHNILKFQNHNLKIEQKIASEVKTRACAPARLSDHHQKLIRDAPYGGEHA